MPRLKSTRPIYVTETYHVMVLHPLERLTKGLLRGDEFELDDIQALRNRCHALVGAFDMRKERETEQDGLE